MDPRCQLDRQLDVLRKSVSRQDFAAVEAAARSCAAVLEAGLSSLPPAEAEARLRDLLNGIEAARRAVLLSRARLAAQLAHLRPRAAYGEDPQAASHRNTFRLDA